MMVNTKALIERIEQLERRANEAEERYRSILTMISSLASSITEIAKKSEDNKRVFKIDLGDAEKFIAALKGLRE